MTPYYDEDGITIYHGDCWEVPARADTIITDPPVPKARPRLARRGGTYTPERTPRAVVEVREA